jgi:23S rRNA-intervening sequence protein
VPVQTDLGERILEYGVRIIKVVESLPKTLVGRRIGDQLLRSGTSVGANFEEAQAAESRDDFVHKLQVALDFCFLPFDFVLCPWREVKGKAKPAVAAP